MQKFAYVLRSEKDHGKCQSATGQRPFITHNVAPGVPIQMCGCPRCVVLAIERVEELMKNGWSIYANVLHPEELSCRLPVMKTGHRKD